MDKLKKKSKINDCVLETVFDSGLFFLSQSRIVFEFLFLIEGARRKVWGAYAS